MNYYPDHLAWQQRCDQERTRKDKHNLDVKNNSIKPLTKTKYDKRLMKSGYTHGFSSLKTLDQVRAMLLE